MLAELGPEFAILREVPLSRDRAWLPAPVWRRGSAACGQGEVERVPGFDGEFGTITLLSPSEIEVLSGQVSLFGASRPGSRKRAATGGHSGSPEPQTGETERQPPHHRGRRPGSELNEQQRPGGWKQRRERWRWWPGREPARPSTLVARIAHLMEKQGVQPHRDYRRHLYQPGGGRDCGPGWRGVWGANGPGGG